MKDTEFSLESFLEDIQWENYAEKDLKAISTRVINNPKTLIYLKALYKAKGDIDKASAAVEKTVSKFMNDIWEFWLIAKDNYVKKTTAIPVSPTKDEKDSWKRFDNTDYMYLLYTAFLVALGYSKIADISADPPLAKNLAMKLKQGKLEEVLDAQELENPLTETTKWDSYAKKDLQGIVKIMMKDAETVKLFKAVYKAKGNLGDAGFAVGIPNSTTFILEFKSKFNEAKLKYLAALDAELQTKIEFGDSSAVKEKEALKRSEDDKYWKNILAGIAYTLKWETLMIYAPDKKLAASLAQALQQNKFEDVLYTKTNVLAEDTKAWLSYAKQDLSGIVNILMKDSGATKMFKAIYKAKGKPKIASEILGLPSGTTFDTAFRKRFDFAKDEYFTKWTSTTTKATAAGLSGYTAGLKRLLDKDYWDDIYASLCLALNWNGPATWSSNPTLVANLANLLKTNKLDEEKANTSPIIAKDRKLKVLTT